MEKRAIDTVATKKIMIWTAYCQHNEEAESYDTYRLLYLSPKAFCSGFIIQYTETVHDFHGNAVKVVNIHYPIDFRAVYTELVGESPQRGWCHWWRVPFCDFELHTL